MVRIDTPEALSLLHEALRVAHSLAVTIIPSTVARPILGQLEETMDSTELAARDYGRDLHQEWLGS